MDLLGGAIWLRVLARGETIPPGYLAGIVGVILDGATRSAPD